MQFSLLRKLGHLTAEFAQADLPRLLPWGVVYNVPLLCVCCILFVHDPLIGICVVPTFLLLWTVLLWTWVYRYHSVLLWNSYSFWKFPTGPGVRTQHFHCRGQVRGLRSCKLYGTAKNDNKTLKMCFFQWNSSVVDEWTRKMLALLKTEAVKWWLLQPSLPRGRVLFSLLFSRLSSGSWRVFQLKPFWNEVRTCSF